MRIIERLGGITRSWITQCSPWTNVYGVARSMLALASAATLLCTSPKILFGLSEGGIIPMPLSVGPAKIGLFSLMSHNLAGAQGIAVALLLLTASGWRPRVTGVLHWWISFSIAVNATLIDGGDQVAAILTLLLIPVCLFDDRPWHWQSSPDIGTRERRSLLSLVCLTLIRVQVAVIYLHAAVAKMAVREWVDGTAVYYWFSHPYFGAPTWRLSLIEPILNSGVGVALISWGSIGLELALFLGLVVSKKVRPFLLTAGVLFHVGIALIHGLVSFALTMIAALILYLRPTEDVFTLSLLLSRNWKDFFRLYPTASSPVVARPN